MFNKMNHFSYLTSIGLHLVVFLIAFYFLEVDLRPDQSTKKRILTPITMIPQNIIQHKKKLFHRPKQIVNSEQGEKSVPLETRFQGKETQVVKKQTIAKRTGSFQEAGRGQSKKQRHINRKVSLKDLGLGKIAFAQHTPPSPAELGQRNGKLHKNGIAQNNDFIDDIPLGDTTYLNTVEFKYFGFYERIRKRLEIFWGQTIQQRAQQIIQRGGRMPAGRNLITSLVITLNHQGIIEKIKVKGSSGIKELDHAAIDSFNQAGPFPNPPRGMVKDGKAQIEWGFVVNSI